MIPARATLALLPILLGLAIPGRLQSQVLGWKTQAEASASLFFGNTEQRLAALRSTIARADSTLESKIDLRFAYADQTTEQDVREVSKRSWLASSTLDYRPFERISPFLIGNVESSYEQRIALRYSGGAGAKYTFVENERVEASFSLAMLAERTRVADGAPEPARPSLARWSARLRLNRRLHERLRVTHLTFYQPEVSELERFTLSSTSTAAYEMNRVLSATVSFLETYDSEATRRGARTNHDGQLLFGLLTSF